MAALTLAFLQVAALLETEPNPFSDATLSYEAMVQRAGEEQHRLWSVSVRGGSYSDFFLGLVVAATNDRKDIEADGWIAGLEVRYAPLGQKGWFSMGLSYDHAEVQGDVAGTTVRAFENFVDVAAYATLFLGETFGLYVGAGAGIKFIEVSGSGVDLKGGGSEASVYVPVGVTAHFDRFAIFVEVGMIGSLDVFARIGVQIAF